MWNRGYCFLMVAIMVGLICACNSDEIESLEELIYPTGNQDFSVEDARDADPLGDHRSEGGDSHTLPARIDHSDRMPRVRSQGHTSSCTSWAVGYYGKTFQEVREVGWDPDQNAFSPAYLYAMQCRTYERPWSINKALKVLQHNGIAKWRSLPFEDMSASGNTERERQNYADLDIPRQAHKEAKIYRCGETASARTLADLKNALTQGPVVLAINQYDSPPRNPSPEDNYMRHNAKKNNIGHAILCVGYDNSKFGSGAIKFVNSWGEGWGENGYCWIRYSDISDIVMHATTFKDIPNPTPPDDPNDADRRPDPPSHVSATDDAGNYVDITWSRTPGAKYYRIYRCEIDDSTTYSAVGISYQSPYRDRPVPGIDYYYSVVAVNDLGESEHRASDTDAASHVDIGSAIGNVLETPTLQWEFNDSDGSHFTVDTIDAAATSMEVLVSTASAGPWNSFGWIKPDDFVIKWGDDSEYANQQPYVRVRVANPDASSGLSEPAQVGENVDNDVVVGRISTYVVTPGADSILLRWMTDGGAIDFFEIWRYNDASGDTNEWVKIGYTEPDVIDEDNFNYFEDSSPLPGVAYFYAVVPVYRGTYGKPAYTDTAFKIEDTGANLKLKYFSYYYSQITSPTMFPKVIVRNDGSTRVDHYTLGILVYDWSDRQVSLVETRQVDVPLEAGSQHTLRLTDIAIAEDYSDGHVYSWGLRVDQAQQIDETYEDDNELWSSDGWWLASDRNAVKTQDETDDIGPRFGNTIPFDQPDDPGELERLSAIDRDHPIVIYNGPSLYHRPDISNDHANRMGVQ